MHRLAKRVTRLEEATALPALRPVLLITPDTDADAELTAWQDRHGPSDVEPLFIHLVELGRE